MNADEIAKADAEWDALPGTRPNGYSFRAWHEIEAGPADYVSSMMAAHPEAKHFRLTTMDDGVWLEAWDERPHKEAAFDPPYTLTPPGATP